MNIVLCLIFFQVHDSLRSQKPIIDRPTQSTRVLFMSFVLGTTVRFHGRTTLQNIKETTSEQPLQNNRFVISYKVSFKYFLDVEVPFRLTFYSGRIQCVREFPFYVFFSVLLLFLLPSSTFKSVLSSSRPIFFSLFLLKNFPRGTQVNAISGKNLLIFCGLLNSSSSTSLPDVHIALRVLTSPRAL